jgi:hypothetical protein
MPDKEELLTRLESVESKLDDVTTRLAEAVAELEHVEEDIAQKRENRNDPKNADNERRRQELHRQIAELGVERRMLIAQREHLSPWSRTLRKRARKLRRRLRNLVRPKVIDLGFDRGAVRGLVAQGTVYGSVGHYTAGPLDDDGDDEAVALWQAYDRAHKGQGWSCLGYNIGISRAGTIYRLRGVEWVGAHTLNYNTGRIGISVHGTTGDTWTRPQLRALRFALKHYGLIDKPVIGHHEAPGQSTACPGSFLAGYHSKGRNA